MWRLIRGLGFAYSYNMIPRPNEGLLHLTFFKATNVIGAYNKTKAILVSQLKLYRYKLIFIHLLNAHLQFSKATDKFCKFKLETTKERFFSDNQQSSGCRK